MNRRGPNKAGRLAAIDEALSRCDGHPALRYADETDLDLRPRIGLAWRSRGRDQQNAVMILAQNEKHDLAGAVHANTGRLGMG